MSRLATPIRKNDNVLVITGKNRGARGRVLKVDPEKNRLVVEGVNIIKRHTKPNPQKNIKGGVVEREAVERARFTTQHGPDVDDRDIDARGDDGDNSRVWWRESFPAGRGIIHGWPPRNDCAIRA